MFKFLKSLFAAPPPALPSLPEITPASLASEAALAETLAVWLRAQPEIAQVEHHPDGLTLRYRDKTECRIFLQNALAALRATDGAERTAYLRNLAASPVSRLEATGARILPVLKPDVFIEAVRAQMAGYPEAQIAEALPLHWPVAPGLIGVYALDTPEKMVMLTRSELDRLGLPLSDLPDLAHTHLLDHLSEAASYQRHDLDGDRFHMWQVDGNYEASLAFHPKLWEAEAKAFGAPPVVAFMARDLVMAVSRDDDEACERLSENAIKAHGQSAYCISPHLYTPGETGGWRLFRRNGEAVGQRLH